MAIHLCGTFISTKLLGCETFCCSRSGRFYSLSINMLASKEYKQDILSVILSLSPSLITVQSWTGFSENNADILAFIESSYTILSCMSTWSALKNFKPFVNKGVASRYFQIVLFCFFCTKLQVWNCIKINIYNRLAKSLIPFPQFQRLVRNYRAIAIFNFSFNFAINCGM